MYFSKLKYATDCEWNKYIKLILAASAIIALDVLYNLYLFYKNYIDT